MTQPDFRSAPRGQLISTTAGSKQASEATPTRRPLKVGGVYALGSWEGAGTS